MSAIISVDFMRKRRVVPPLVFLELHSSEILEAEGFGAEQISPVLSNCRRLLAHARSRLWPVAFVTPLRGFSPNMRARNRCWIDGFEPQRTDMIFERGYPSCYSSREFADAISDVGGTFLVAGFSSDCAALSTIIDAYSHGHHVEFIEDATATRPLPGLTASNSHAAVTAIASRYAALTTTLEWMETAGFDRSDLEPEYETADRG